MPFLPDDYYHSLRQDHIKCKNVDGETFVVQAWLRCLTQYDRKALALYDDKAHDYPPIYEGSIVNKAGGWEFIRLDAERCICLPPWRKINPCYLPYLGCYRGEDVIVKDTICNSSSSLPPANETVQEPGVMETDEDEDASRKRQRPSDDEDSGSDSDNALCSDNKYGLQIASLLRGFGGSSF